MWFKYIIPFVLMFVTILSAQENQRYWIYFRDKENVSINELTKDSHPLISDRALQRRELRGTGALFDFADLPISKTYIKKLESHGIKIYRESRWLNAVSCYLNGISLTKIKSLPFVLKVDLVRKNILRPSETSDQPILEKSVLESYGPSFNQNNMIGVPYAHEMGFHGEGVLIAVFDQGFILDHEALRHIEVVDAWDFIYDDDIVEDEEEDIPGQHNHGTRVLSVLAGYAPGNLIGPAYASQFLLAKTDHLTFENKQDEDNWVAAAEWAEGLGADIISSSLGFILDYSYQDMDGNTTAVTIAADIAVKKGVSVFNAAGNEGQEYWEHIIAPADGDSVIAMGAVTANGDYWAVSSRGPTYDGRVKPDLAAQGRYTYCVNPGSIDRYSTVSGTSVSCPLGSGAGAILLSVMPSLTPMELKDLLVKHASQSNNPDNFLGYGIINLEQTIYSLVGDPVVSVNSFEVIPRHGNNLIQWIVDLEVANKEWIVSRRTPDNPFIEIGKIEGREFGVTRETYSFYDYEVEGGEIFTYKLSTQFLSGDRSEIDTVRLQSSAPSNIALFNNSPNPFNSETKITFGLNTPQNVSLKIYGISGQLIKTLINNQQLEAKYHHIPWDGSNDQSISVSTGTYFLRLTAGDEQKMMKMLYLK
jgi:hypothetical protein